MKKMKSTFEDIKIICCCWGTPLAEVCPQIENKKKHWREEKK